MREYYASWLPSSSRKNNVKTAKNPKLTSKAHAKLGTSVNSKFSTNPIAAHEPKIDVPPTTTLVALPNVAPLLPPPPPPPPLPLNLNLSTQSFSPKISSSADSGNDLFKKSQSKKTMVTSTIGNNNMDSVVSAIKSGSIKLKKVEQQQRRKSSPLKDDGSPSGRLLAEMMSKIRNLAHLSSDDDDDDCDAELNDEFD
uniref:WH2 domain-containing protein n=1 Tax=Romanomermis culicivorax TaxID=13658 RepID=A0A915LC67_ROMCU